jgi:hypothetical protein
MYVMHEHKYIIVGLVECTTEVVVQKNKDAVGNDHLPDGLIDLIVYF